MKKVLVFGIGGNMFHAYKYINARYDVVAFIYNNVNLQGMVIADKPIVSINDVNRLEYESVIVTPTLHQSICQQLFDCGVPHDKILLLRDLAGFSQYKEVSQIAFCLQGV